ncbi:polysaccharide biosynthesis tyrosine autokinase [Demequina sp.]|uniref:polysaccharide biosynthesis tyrosine autokinase n=1 Tax=Demequina sp. TaxID=2050685 RepID=UPI0025FF4520|nr:polysaccharide biosynthesis tyrosine autokinase [Demequina sp.]
MELRDYLRIVRKNWILIVVITMLGGFAGWSYATLATPVYTAQAKVFVSTTGAASTAELAQGNSFTLQRVQTYSDLVKTAAVLEPTIEELGLDASVPDVRGRVSASSPQNTTIIDVTASGPDPASAAALATETARQLVIVVETWERTEGMTASPVALKIAQEAEQPGVPTSPNLMVDIAIGLLVGLSLGVAAALLRSALDTKVHTERDVRRITTVPVLGGIPFDPRARTRPLIVQDDSHSILAESFRSLRTNLQFLRSGQGSQSIVLTSSVPGEGKSTTAANLAIALADAQARVILVEADLRRPKITQYMGLEGGVGLSDVIIGRIELDDAIQSWGPAGLHVLPAGQLPPNPSELLGSPAMAEVVRRLDEDFDVVIYDAPPLLPVTDAAVLAQHVGSTVVVVAIGRAHVPELRSALEAAANVGVPASGVILSMVPTTGADSYGYRRYDYAYESAEKAPASRRLRVSWPLQRQSKKKSDGGSHGGAQEREAASDAAVVEETKVKGSGATGSGAKGTGGKGSAFKDPEAKDPEAKDPASEDSGANEAGAKNTTAEAAEDTQEATADRNDARRRWGWRRKVAAVDAGTEGEQRAAWSPDETSEVTESPDASGDNQDPQEEADEVVDDADTAKSPEGAADADAGAPPWDEDDDSIAVPDVDDDEADDAKDNHTDDSDADLDRIGEELDELDLEAESLGEDEVEVPRLVEDDEPEPSLRTPRTPSRPRIK